MFSKNPQMSNFMKIRPVGAELFHADRRTDDVKKWHDKYENNKLEGLHQKPAKMERIRWEGTTTSGTTSLKL